MVCRITLSPSEYFRGFLDRSKNGAEARKASRQTKFDFVIQIFQCV